MSDGAAIFVIFLLFLAGIGILKLWMIVKEYVSDFVRIRNARNSRHSDSV